MASQEEIRLQQEQNNLLREQNELLKQRRGTTEDTLDDLRSFANLIQDQTKQIQFQVSEKRQLRSISNQILKISQESFSGLESELGTQKNINDLTKKRQILQKSLINLESLKNKFVGDDAELNANINKSIEDQILAIGKLNQELKTQQQLSEKIANNFGVKIFGSLSDITKAIPGLSRFSVPFKEAEEAARKQVIQNQKINAAQSINLQTGKGLTKEKIKELGLADKLLDKNGDILEGAFALSRLKKTGDLNLIEDLQKKNPMNPLIAGAKNLGKSLTNALAPAAILGELLLSIVKVNKESIELQKSLLLTSAEAKDFRLQLSIAAKQSGDINVTASKLLESFSSLNTQFGFITNFSKDTLVTMTQLTQKVGTSAESAGNLAAASSLTGKSFEENYKDVLGTSYELQRQSGVQMDLRDILEQTGKITGTVRANLGSNPALIAKAITQAKIFGATLEQVANAGEALLNFESSIESELQAELLLGRNINLEKARQAALMGDQVTLAQELQQQAGSYSDFQNMNVIQQQALAQAMGMTSDQMADILFQQEIQGRNAKELRAMGKDDLADRLEQQNLQEKFTNSVLKLKEAFTEIATIVMPIVEGFANIVAYIAQSETALLALQTVIAGLAVKSIITAIASIFTGSAKLGPPGLIIAAAATAGLMGYITSATNKVKSIGDLNSPADGKTQISTKEGGLFELSPNDDVIAAPGAARAMARATQPQQPVVIQNDNTESKETNALLRQILSKQGTVKMDATEVGTAFSVNTYSVQ
jgi:hypothetical protein